MQCRGWGLGGLPSCLRVGLVPVQPEHRFVCLHLSFCSLRRLGCPEYRCWVAVCILAALCGIWGEEGCIPLLPSPFLRKQFQVAPGSVFFTFSEFGEFSHQHSLLHFYRLLGGVPVPDIYLLLASLPRLRTAECWLSLPRVVT